jgi:ABC-2 type transport system ATP-binding protein
VLEKVKLTDAASRRIGAYSKGMRQRIKLAQAMSHEPSVLVLDEPLNGLDPMARAEVIDLFKQVAASGAHVIVSSHILHEVDMIADQVVLLSGGYVVAEGDISQVREEMPEHPIQVLVRCDRPALLASRMFELDNVVEVKLQEDGGGLLVRTRNAESFYRRLNQSVLETGIEVEAVAPADEDVHSVYQYLIGSNGGGAG